MCCLDFMIFFICIILKGLSVCASCPEALQIAAKRLVLDFSCLSQVLLELSKLNDKTSTSKWEIPFSAVNLLNAKEEIALPITFFCFFGLLFVTLENMSSFCRVKNCVTLIVRPVTDLNLSCVWSNFGFWKSLDSQFWLWSLDFTPPRSYVCSYKSEPVNVEQFQDWRR